MIVDIASSVIRSKENMRVHMSRVFEDSIGTIDLLIKI
jgi:hypothetical protein